MGSKTRLGSYCTKRANNGVNLVTSRKINTRLARPMEPLLRDQPDERPTPLERPLVNVNLYINIQWNPSCEATPFASEKWPFKRGGHSSGVKINTFMFIFTLSSGLSRGCGLSPGWPLKRGSTVMNSTPFLRKMDSLTKGLPLCLDPLSVYIC